MKSKYEALQQKYGLPGLGELEPDFELYTIENLDFLLKEIAKKIGEKLEFFAKLVEEQIQPESSLSAMHECDNYSESEKKMLFEVYKRLLYWHRTYVFVELRYEEKECAEFVRGFLNEWPKLREQVRKIINRMQDTWVNHRKGDSDLEYFG